MKQDLEKLGEGIVDAAFQVHSHMGPGLLESIYQNCLQKELSSHGIQFQIQHPIPLVYKGEALAHPLFLDFWIEDSIVVELKAVETLLPVHSAQILSYMKLARSPLGFLINFNVPLIKNGIKRFKL